MPLLGNDLSRASEGTCLPRTEDAQSMHVFSSYLCMRVFFLLLGLYLFFLWSRRMIR